MAQARAKPAPEENQEIANRTFPASAKSAGTEVLPQGSNPCKDSCDGAKKRAAVLHCRLNIYSTEPSRHSGTRDSANPE
jgi:hypothetical protein